MEQRGVLMSYTAKLIGKQMQQCFTNNWRKRHGMPMLRKPTKKKILKELNAIKEALS